MNDEWIYLYFNLGHLLVILHLRLLKCTIPQPLNVMTLNVNKKKKITKNHQRFFVFAYTILVFWGHVGFFCVSLNTPAFYLQTLPPPLFPNKIKTTKADIFTFKLDRFAINTYIIPFTQVKVYTQKSTMLYTYTRNKYVHVYKTYDRSHFLLSFDMNVK